MKAMPAAAVLRCMVRRYGVFAGESIWAPDRVVSVSFMCGMVACGGGGWQGFVGGKWVACVGYSAGYFGFVEREGSLLFSGSVEINSVVYTFSFCLKTRFSSYSALSRMSIDMEKPLCS